MNKYRAARREMIKMVGLIILEIVFYDILHENLDI